MTNQAHSTIYAAPRFRTAKRALVALLLLAAFIAALWFGRVAVLRGAADLWIVSDPVAPTDVVVVLGGGILVRAPAAAELYKEGMTKKILVSNVGQDNLEKNGALPSHTALNQMALVRLGVPETAIEGFGVGLKNTHQEVVALHDWAIRNHIHSLTYRLRSSRRGDCAGRYNMSLPAPGFKSWYWLLILPITTAPIGGAVTWG